MFGWFKKKKEKDNFELVGTSDWQINWKDTGTNTQGMYLLYESKTGKRKFESSLIPWVYKGEGGIKRLPGYNYLLRWSLGGELPPGFMPLPKKGGSL